MIPSGEQFRALFEPRGIVVAGASTHPGKFGFVSLHNIISCGYGGAIFATNRDGSEVLGISTFKSLDELPDQAADLIFLCTPRDANPELLRAAAAKGVRAAFITSAGYGEAGEDGSAAEAELVSLAAELEMVVIGPNGQGIVSTPANLCAQIVAPYPPAGSISIASQSGNFVSSFMNWACATGVGVARAVSAGNAAVTDVADLLLAFGDDPSTSVGLAYIEGTDDGRRLFEAMEQVCRRMPLVVLKGGATEGGAAAAASHTGSLASNDRVFTGAAAQAGATRAMSVEEAFETAATFATQPLPRGNRVAVVTTAGGWGVMAADSITSDKSLELVELPDDLRSDIDKHLPPRWSRSNPIDMAGGETRDTIPTVLELVAKHDSVDAVLYLGLGIQSNQARLMRQGPFSDDPDVARIVAYHERQDSRFAQAAHDVSVATGKPVLCATELAVAFPDNPGPATVRRTGRVCYPSAERAVRALGHLARRSEFLRSRGIDVGDNSSNDRRRHSEQAATDETATR